jgi:hypothetical protein
VGRAVEHDDGRVHVGARRLDRDIALPAIFRGINLDPLAAGNISNLLWMIMGYRLVQAVLVVTVGRLGDMNGVVDMLDETDDLLSRAAGAIATVRSAGGHVG